MKTSNIPLYHEKRKPFKSLTLKGQEQEVIKRDKLVHNIHISHEQYVRMFIKGFINIKLNILTKEGLDRLNANNKQTY